MRAEGDDGSRAVALSAGDWLFRPVPRPATVRATMRFALPAGMGVSVPWRREGDVRVLGDVDFRFLAHTAFGNMDRLSLDVAGGRIDAAVLPGTGVARDAVRAWLQKAASAVSTVGGRFPADHTQVVVAPVAPGPNPVAFGLVGRSGGASVLLLLRRRADPHVLADDWVAVHELSHLLLPFVRRQDAWLSEGMATYYEEMLRVRAGLQPEQAAFQNLDDGFRRGRSSAPGLDLDEASRRMFAQHDFQRVYWSGARFMLAADVALRTRPERPSSLDRVVAGMGEPARTSGRVWTAAQVLRRLDAIDGSHLFRDLGRRYEQSRTLPGWERLWQRLGVEYDAHGRVVLSDQAPLASVRDAICRLPAPQGSPHQ